MIRIDTNFASYNITKSISTRKMNLGYMKIFLKYQSKYFTEIYVVVSFSSFLIFSVKKSSNFRLLFHQILIEINYRGWRKWPLRILLYSSKRINLQAITISVRVKLMSKDKDSKYTPPQTHINEYIEHLMYFLCNIMHHKIEN